MPKTRKELCPVENLEVKSWFKWEDRLNHLLCLILAIFSNKFSKKKANKRNPHSPGLYRTIQESLTSFTQTMIWAIGKLNPFRLLSFLPDLIGSSFQLMGMWLSSLRHLDVVFVSIVLFASMKITYDKYKLLKQDVITKINLEETNSKYSPLTRPVYHKKNEKQFTMYSIRVPIHKKNSKSPSQIVMDFTVETSNKYIKEYLDQRMYLVKDRFNSTIQPIISKLPLKNEGKTILAKKVKREINELLKSLKIKGKVDRVYIHAILVSWIRSIPLFSERFSRYCRLYPELLPFV